MPLTILKLVASGTTIAKPTARNYFHKPTTTQSSISRYTINVADCTTNTGGTVAAFTTATTSNGYYMLFVNGVLQEANVYTVGSTKVVLHVTADGNKFTLRQSAPITLSVINFDPSTVVTG